MSAPDDGGRLGARAAGASVRAILKKAGLGLEVHARNVGFQDLARCHQVFVDIRCPDRLPGGLTEELTQAARRGRFIVMLAGPAYPFGGGLK